MKNPYKKGKVHPSPPPPPTLDNYLSILPATILTLTSALSPQDKQVLTYLISCCGTPTSTTCSSTKWRATQKPITRDDHYPSFGCDCFRCYMSYWARWDASPNRQVIDEIIEAYEEELVARDKKKKVVKKKKEKGKNVCEYFDEERGGVYRDSRLEKGKKVEGFMGKEELNELGDSSCSFGQSEVAQAGILDNNGTVIRKIVSFIGDQIWGFWSRD